MSNRAHWSTMDVTDEELDAQFLQQFNALGTSDKEELIQRMRNVIGSNFSNEYCSFFLDSADWFVSSSVQLTFPLYTGIFRKQLVHILTMRLKLPYVQPPFLEICRWVYRLKARHLPCPVSIYTYMRMQMSQRVHHIAWHSRWGIADPLRGLMAHLYTRRQTPLVHRWPLACRIQINWPGHHWSPGERSPSRLLSPMTALTWQSHFSILRPNPSLDHGFTLSELSVSLFLGVKYLVVSCVQFCRSYCHVLVFSDASATDTQYSFRIY